MGAGDFEIATVFESEAEAKAAAATLLENGVGAQLEQVVRDVAADDSAAESSTSTAADVAASTERGYAVQVLGVDLPRALEVLGLEVRVIPEGTDDKAAEPEKTKVNWKVILPIWLAAMIIIPLFAFWLSYTLLSR